MPVYSYRCRTCDHQFEIRQRMTDDPLTECPNCQGEVRRVVNSVGVVFKGKGFYVTDNRSGATATLPGASAKEEKADKTGSESKEGKESKESKPAGESAAKESKSKESKVEKPASAPAA
jgi:putative FmdB family regulatory protein